MVTGITMPGNSTKLRTGTMIIASGGSGGKVCWSRALSGPLPAGSALCSNERITSFSTTVRPRFLKGNQKTSIRDGPDGPTHNGRPAGVRAARSGPAAIPADGSRRCAARAGSTRLPATTRSAAVDGGLDPVWVDAGQRHEHQHVALGLQHVDRRLPGRAAGWRCPAGRTRGACARRARACRTPPTTSSYCGKSLIDCLSDRSCDVPKAEFQYRGDLAPTPRAMN